MNINLLELSSQERSCLDAYVLQIQSCAYGNPVDFFQVPKIRSMDFKKYANYIDQPFEIHYLAGSFNPRREIFVVQIPSGDKITLHKLESGYQKLIFPDKSIYTVSSPSGWLHMNTKLDPPTPVKLEDTFSPVFTMGSSLSIVSSTDSDD